MHVVISSVLIILIIFYYWNENKKNVYNMYVIVICIQSEYKMFIKYIKALEHNFQHFNQID